MKALNKFLKMESAPGILLMIAGAAAMILANSPFANIYVRLWDTHATVGIGDLILDKTLLHWINDGLMAVFFLLVGLEIKREILNGELSDPRKLALPGFGAVGGMLFPALVYLALNRGDAQAQAGWAIPAATDIAFALGVLTLLGNRVPVGLKAFLLTLAILDDLGAIVIIAFFYTADLSGGALMLAVIAVLALIVMNLAGVRRIAAYILVGIFLWVCVLKSGVHATLAGVAVAFAVPMRTPFDQRESTSPLLSLEHALQPWVVRGIMPLFALANAGVPLAGLTFSDLLRPVPLGIALGLLLGKLIGVLAFSGLAVGLRIAKLPTAVTWPQMVGTSFLCGIGFTMSLFISGLAFHEPGHPHATVARLGIMAGSLIASVLGFLILWRTLPASCPRDEHDDTGAFLAGEM